MSELLATGNKNKGAEFILSLPLKQLAGQI